MNNLQQLRQRKQGGYTMLELLLVIGIIIALTSVMIYALLSRANKQSAFTQAGAQVAQIANAERNAISTSGAGFVAIDGLGQYGLSQDITTNATHSNPWGGAYDVADNSDGTFKVTASNVPADMSKGYDRFIHQISTIGEQTASQGGQAQGQCKPDGNTITCTFDNA